MARKQLGEPPSTPKDAVTKEYVDALGFPARHTLTVPTTTGDETWTLALGFRIISIAATGPARLRLYRTAADRTADAPRSYIAEPTPNSGLICEFRWDAAGTYWAEPPIDGYVNDWPYVYAHVDEGSPEFTITWQRTE